MELRPKILSVLIADDHEIVSQALAGVINNETGMRAVTANARLTALEQIAAHGAFDVVLLDIGMPGMNGLESVQELIKANTGGAVVIFSGLVNRDFVASAIQLGARGYIPKTLPLKSLSSAINLVASGQIYIPMEFAFGAAAASKGDRLALTAREKGVLVSVSAGKTNKEIAYEIGLSEISIKMIMRSICNKLGAKNRTHAVVVARTAQII